MSGITNNNTPPTANTNRDQNELIQQKGARAIAFYQNNLELADPLQLQINRPQQLGSSSLRSALQYARTTQISLTLQQQLAILDPSQFRITVNPAVYPPGPTGPVIPPFKPSDISGCVIWLDAADSSTLTLSGLNVTGWTDKSGKGNTITITSSGGRPSWNSTRQSVITGSGGFFSLPIQTVVKEYGFFVYQAYSSTGSDFFVGNANYSRRIRLGGATADFSTYNISWVIGPDVNLGGGINTTNLFRFDTTSRLSLNRGATTFTGNALSTFAIQTGTLTRLGEFAGSLGGEIMEAIVYQNVDLTPANIVAVENYLATKWKL